MNKTFCFLFCLWVTACSPRTPINDPFHNQTPSTEGTVGSGGGLKIFPIDIGQGDATLVIGPSGKTLLIDAGPKESGVSKILPLLNALEVTHLDWMVATHYDADHIGGIAEVLKGGDQVLGTEDDFIPTQGIFDRGDFTEKSTPTFSGYLQTTDPYREEAFPGMIFPLGDGASAKVIVVNGNYSDGRSIHLNPDEENDACIGLLIQYGDFQYFTAGDLTGGGSPGGYETKDMESITGEILGDIDVLHVGHHGSLTSTNEVFLDEITPEAAIISVGKDNDYGHPTSTVLNRLEEREIEIYRTDQLGTIEIDSDGIDYKIGPR